MNCTTWRREKLKKERKKLRVLYSLLIAIWLPYHSVVVCLSFILISLTVSCLILLCIMSFFFFSFEHFSLFYREHKYTFLLWIPCFCHQCFDMTYHIVAVTRDFPRLHVVSDSTDVLDSIYVLVNNLFLQVGSCQRERHTQGNVEWCQFNISNHLHIIKFIFDFDDKKSMIAFAVVRSSSGFNDYGYGSIMLSMKELIIWWNSNRVR